MPAIRLLFLWHMHQPFYKDLVTGRYRLPWVRLHAVKDYFGMVRLLDEFPGVHQTFNLAPSLIAQIRDYVGGAAQDPFLDIAARPAPELNDAEKQFALQYLFQANADHMIGRYPRYRELWQRFQSSSPEAAARLVSDLTDRDLTDLQVLSQIAWMDEFFLDEPPLRELIGKGHDYSLEDQQLVVQKEREFLARVLPAYAAARDRGGIEISTSPYYHPILPLICDTEIGAVSHSGLPLPAARFQHAEDAREQIRRGLDLHEQVFGARPRGMWPSEGSVSNEVMAIAHSEGLQWAASDEGVLGRSLAAGFPRDGSGRLEASGAETLYQIYRWQQGEAAMNLVFRDHSLSDLIGFVYSGMPAGQAAHDFIRRVKESAEPILAKGQNAVVSIILDGENAWESYPQSGREFLRRLYDGIQTDPVFEALTVSEAVEREPSRGKLDSVFPGSWINANFDVWIGAPEDNLAWDYLSAARDFFREHADAAAPEQRDLAREELLIAEGSDWNWWYGPEHHSANDRDFDELYRKHLANVYQALGASPPHALAHPIAATPARPRFTPQTAYIQPLIDGKDIGYFDWLGAATHVAERHSSAMHGSAHLLDTGYAGIDDRNLYCRVDFIENPANWEAGETRLVVTVEPVKDRVPGPVCRLDVDISAGRLRSFTFARNGEAPAATAARAEASVARDAAAEDGAGAPGACRMPGISVGMDSLFECQIPLAMLPATPESLLRIRFSLWRDRLPVDSLPHEGSIDVRVVPESELSALPYAKP